MLREDRGAVVLGVTLAIGRYDEFGEADDLAGGLLDGSHRVQVFASGLDDLGDVADAVDVPDLRSVRDVADGRVVHRGPRRGVRVDELVGDDTGPGFEAVSRWGGDRERGGVDVSQ